ncbi:MAG: MATE family efflux transporter [Candidatus Methanomethylophilaceae archaeon]
MNETKRMTHDVETLLGNPKRAIIVMAVPLAISLFVQNLNNLVDVVWVVGLGADAMCAVGLIYPLYSTLTGLGTGIGIGASSAIARRLGRGEKELADRTAAQTILLIFLVAIIITPIFVLLVRPLLLYSGTDTTLQYGLDFGYPLTACSIVTLMLGVITGLLRSEGAAKRSMIVLVTCAVLNIIFDPLLIYTAGLGTAGAAWATILATSISLIIAFYWYLVKKDLYIDLNLKHLKFSRPLQKDIMVVGFPQSLELSIMAIMNIFMNAYIMNVGGSDAMAVYSSVWKLNYMLLIPAQAIAAAIVPVCAAAYGMKRFDRIGAGYYYSLKITIAVMTVISVAVFLFADQTTMMFAYSGNMQRLQPDMVDLLRICCVYLVFMSWIFISSSLLQSLGKGMLAMTSSLLRNLLILGIFAYASTFGYIGALWWGLAYGEIIGSIGMGLLSLAVLHSIMIHKDSVMKDEDHD